MTIIAVDKSVGLIISFFAKKIVDNRVKPVIDIDKLFVVFCFEIKKDDNR